MKKNPIFLWTVSFVLVVIITFAFLEIGLGFLPVCEPTHRLEVNAQDPILRFEPNRSLLWSRGWSFKIVNRVKVNNFGFVNNYDYHPKSTKPLFGIIGDSYVQAIMVPFPETLVGRLQQSVGDEARIYSFGVSGSPLSQYLAYAEYAQKTFSPEGLAVVIIGNDFDESLYKYKRDPGYHYFIPTEGGELGLKRIDYSPGYLKRLARKSTLGRYLGINLELPSRFQSLKSQISNQKDIELYVGNTLSRADGERVEVSKKAVDAFLKLLPEKAKLEPKDILFVVDGRRPHLYNDKGLAKTKDSFFSLMRNYFIAQAESFGFEVVDMEPVFLSHNRIFHDRFEFPGDNHWNSLGHQLAFEKIQESQTFQRFRGPHHF